MKIRINENIGTPHFKASKSQERGRKSQIEERSENLTQSLAPCD